MQTTGVPNTGSSNVGCPAEVQIGKNLTFSICTHDPDTGVLTDADSAPAYRVYEDETATPILTGTMDKLDDGSTTGFYVETIACTSANGFETGKTYTIYIEATVDSDTGGIAYAFKADNVLQRLATTGIGDCTGAGTGTETFDYDSITATVTVDTLGNRTIAWS